VSACVVGLSCVDNAKEMDSEMSVASASQNPISLGRDLIVIRASP
jgi:hypothetical protein